ncbi:MAG TPA: TolC family protein [Polyangia bacterium]|nr:TolC family protein [Polyangia bacterium]
MRRLAFALAVTLGASLFSRAAFAERLTVEDVVARALASHPSVVASRARAAGGRAGSKSAFGRMLPSVHVSDEYQHWDSPFAINFGGGSFRARDQDTNSFAATADQPLVGLLRLHQDWRAEHASAEAADAQARVVEAALRESIESEYLRMFQALALEQIAIASERELSEQVTIADAKVRAGVLTTADLLRVRVAAANARQQAIVARTQAQISRVTLLAAIGLAPDAPVELAEPTSLLDGDRPYTQVAPVPSLIERALGDRLELKQAELTARAARHRARSRLYALLPDIDAEGGYLRVDGQVFAPPNQEYVGARASWAIWDWGANWYARSAAARLADAAAADVEAERRQIRVEVASRRALVESAASAVELARETIASAEEAYRITDAQLKAGTATTTDLLDAQSALTQSRLSLTRARYEEAVARVSLARAIGE